MDRVNCGYGGMTQAQCEAKGCCYDEKEWGVPWCFNKVASLFCIAQLSAHGGKSQNFYLTESGNRIKLLISILICVALKYAFGKRLKSLLRKVGLKLASPTVS